MKLILTIGIPGSGKSTWAAGYAKENPNTIIVSSDGIRKELTGTEECDPSMNGKIFAVVRERVAKGILEHDVIVDATNTRVKDWKTYRELCPDGTEVCARFFDVDPDTAMEYQSHRERQVPREVLDRFWDTIQSNAAHIPEYFDVIFPEVWMQKM